MEQGWGKVAMADFARVYASAPDELLIDLHKDLDSLEPEARAALLAEIKRRGDAFTMAAINANLATILEPPSRGFWLNLLAVLLIVLPFISGLMLLGERTLQVSKVPALATNAQWQTYGYAFGVLWVLSTIACVLSGAAIIHSNRPSTPSRVIWVLWLAGPGIKLLSVRWPICSGMRASLILAPRRASFSVAPSSHRSGRSI
jgi:hypothetical protein